MIVLDVVMRRRILCFLLVFSIIATLFAEDSAPPWRCELIPLPEQQVAFRIDGKERTRWHFGESYPRPFFYPFNGPSGVSLTRMGHPGASDHDHHRSVWFAFHKVNEDLSFWGDESGMPTQIRQKEWLAYEDGEEEAIMACMLDYVDHKAEAVVMVQETVAAIRPMPDGEYVFEIQITLRPPDGRDTVVLQKTNFGLLAVRVAKSISEHFGGGRLTSSSGATGEPAIFGNAAKWMDYSGPVVVGQDAERRLVTEGITYFDHPGNPRHPAKWHVRSDGWMGASVCMDDSIVLTSEEPLRLRYLLYSHRGAYDAEQAEKVAAAFASRPAFQVGQRGSAHRRWEVWRETKEP